MATAVSPFCQRHPFSRHLVTCGGSLDPKELDNWFSLWAQTLQQHVQEVLAIDGKSLRGSGDTENQRPQHLLNAFACQDRIVLAQEPVADKSNEITGVPMLLKKLQLKGRIVTIDAMGCQKKIAGLIQKKEGDSVLALKRNHGTLHDLVRDSFEHAEREDFPAKFYAKREEVDKGDGGVEKRLFVAFLREIFG